MTTVFTHLKCRCEMSNNHFITTMWSSNNQTISTACQGMVFIPVYFRDSGQSLHSRRRCWLFGPTPCRVYTILILGNTVTLVTTILLCRNPEAYLFTAGRGDSLGDSKVLLSHHRLSKGASLSLADSETQLEGGGGHKQNIYMCVIVPTLNFDMFSEKSKKLRAI